MQQAAHFLGQLFAQRSFERRRRDERQTVTVADGGVMETAAGAAAEKQPSFEADFEDLVHAAALRSWT